MQVLLAVNHFFIFAAATLMRLEEARLLYPPRQETSKTVRRSVMCNLYSRDCDGKRWRKNKTLYLFPQRHPAAQSTGQTDDFGHKRLEREVLLQDHPPQYRLHLRNTWTWEIKKKEMPGGMMERREKVRWKKAIMERGMRGERGGEGAGGADWYSYSFMYAHLITRYIVWISCSRDH